MTRPRIGVLLPNFDAVRAGQPLPIVPAARLAEELGFDAAWVGDHLACPAPGLDAPACLAAAAAVTDTISLGPQRDAAGPARAGVGGQDPGHDRLACPGDACCSASASAASSRMSSRPPACPCASAAPGSTTR